MLCSRSNSPRTNSTIGLVGRTFCCAALLMTLFAQATAVSAEDGEAPSFLVAGMRVMPKRWDKKHNFGLIERYAREAASQGAQLVVTGEGFLDGYTGNPKLNPEFTREKYFANGEPIDGPWINRVRDLAEQLKIYLSIGFSERRGDQMFNSVAVFSPAGKLILHYSKTHTKGEPYNTFGNKFPVIETDIGTFGALICYDRRFPEVPRILALKGAQVLLVPAFGTDGERNEALLRTRAWENSVYVVYVKPNQSLIIDPTGKIIARDSGKGDELVFGRIVLDDEVGTGDILHRRSPDIYRELLELQQDK